MFYIVSGCSGKSFLRGKKFSPVSGNHNRNFRELNIQIQEFYQADETKTPAPDLLKRDFRVAKLKDLRATGSKHLTRFL